MGLGAIEIHRQIHSYEDHCGRIMSWLSPVCTWICFEENKKRIIWGCDPQSQLAKALAWTLPRFLVPAGKFIADWKDIGQRQPS